jgi:hypothetical protein
MAQRERRGEPDDAARRPVDTAAASPLRGLSTVNLFAADHAAARAWYTEFLGVEPYFERPGYVEFRIGDYQGELGIIDSKYVPGTQSHDGRAGSSSTGTSMTSTPCSPRPSAWAPRSWRRPRTVAMASSPPPRSTRSATSSGSCTTPITWRSCLRSSQPERGDGRPQRHRTHPLLRCQEMGVVLS